MRSNSEQFDSENNKEGQEKGEPVQKNLECTQEDFKKMVQEAEAQISAEENDVLENAQQRIDHAPESSNLDPQKAESVFISSGIAERVASAKEEVISLGKSTKEKIFELSSDHPEAIHIDPQENYIPLPEPLPGETPEEFIARFQTLLTNKYIENNSDIQNQAPLVRKAYYGNYMRQALDDFNNSEQMRNKFIDTLHHLKENENVRQSPEKDEKTLKMIEKMIQVSSKDSATGEAIEKVEYYANTNQSRRFLEKGRKHDAHSYAHMMFGLPEEFVNTPQGLQLLHEKVDGKSIFLFGGGESVHDLLTSKEFNPRSVINFDPYLKSESIDGNTNNIYRSEAISAADLVISQKIGQGEIPKADEIWMTYSVPFYLDNSKEIKDLISNATSSLNEDGNTRINPIMLQNTETDGENFDIRKKALIDSLQNLMDSKDYNVTVFGDTIKIHKIKKSTEAVKKNGRK